MQSAATRSLAPLKNGAVDGTSLIWTGHCVRALTGEPAGSPVSALTQWPVQIRLVPSTAPFFRGARLLVAADCTAYAFAGFHERFMRGRVTLIGCPKLDPVQYGEKLTEILTLNDIRSVAVVRMEVPCCGGIVAAVRQALQASGKNIPWSVTVISTDGRIADFS